MPRRGATLTQADVARALRAARQAGAGNVEIRPDGTIVINLHPSPMLGDNSTPPVDQDEVIPL